MSDFDKHFQRQIARDKQQKKETFNKIMTDIELIHKRQLRIYVAKRIGLILLALAIMFGLLALINHYDILRLEQGLLCSLDLLVSHNYTMTDISSPFLQLFYDPGA